MAGIEDIRSDFIEKVGQIVQGEGLPKIAGRVFGLLMFDGTPVSFGDLAQELQVSRGSISSSVRLLETRGVIKRVGLPGERQDYFRITEDPFTGLLEGAMRRFDRASHEIEASLSDLPDDAACTRERLRTYAAFYKTLGRGLQQALTVAEHQKG